MSRTDSGGGRYVLAAAVGGVCGGVAALLATRELPKLFAGMKDHMHEICAERCACAPSEAPESSVQAEANTN